MGTIDIHEKPFGEETLTKLNLFEAYIKEWLPTFIMSGYKDIYIFDFFAGPGYDKAAIPGTPIRILTQIKNEIGNIFIKGTNIHICFNEYNKNKFNTLKCSCEEYCNNNKELNRANIQIEYYQMDFKDLFPQKIKTIDSYPSLVLLDQNGIKFLSDEFFIPLVNSHCTDFLYFVASSYIRRFGETDEFKKSLKGIDYEYIKENPYKYIHKCLLNELKGRIPSTSKIALYPFTIKKGQNIYGIIFGSSHIRGVDKFLKTAWSINKTNGEANFDIDSDEEKSQGDLFLGKQMTKIESFRNDLHNKIKFGEIKTNKEAYIYTLRCGLLSVQATDEVKQMKKNKIINYQEKSPLINYEQVYQKGRIVQFELLK
jgi:three-Cys-motif partner protein